MPGTSLNIVYDTNYTAIIPNGGMVSYTLPPKKVWFLDSLFWSSKTTQTPQNTDSNTSNTQTSEEKKEPKKQKGIFDDLLGSLFGSSQTTKKKTKKESDENKENKEGEKSEWTPEDPQKAEAKAKKRKTLKDKVKGLLEIPDDEYSDKLLTSDVRKFLKDAEDNYTKTITDFKTHMAPSYWKAETTSINVSGILGKCYYTASYPTYMDTLWTRDILALHSKRDWSFFLYPEDDTEIQGVLKKKTTQLRAELSDAMQKGITVDKEMEQQYKDIEMIRDKLSTKEERYFELSNYFTVYENTDTALHETSKKYEQKIGGFGVRVKAANHRMDEGFTSTLPLAIDDLGISRSSVTTSLAGSFPFISNDLVSPTGILYGVNMHTWGLVIFDRFNSKLPNMNSVILATSGAGKSFTVKLEILRYLLNGVDIIVIDPENEYKQLVDVVWGTYVNIATNSQQCINPFDIPPKIGDVEYGKWDLLRSQIMNLIGLIQIMIGGTTPEEEALLDKALQNTYALKGFSLEEEEYEGKQPPIMEDLMNTLEGMDGGDKMSLKISKYVNGTFGKLFNNYTNVDIGNSLTVFSIRDLEDALKTPAMFNVLNFIWTKVRSQKKQRLLICDEAWILLQNKTSASFLFGLIKRARKYGLGITTISQDIEDFVKSEFGKPIISNSSFQILLKQSTTSIKSLNGLLGLSEAEQQRLISWGVGEGLIFAGNKHIAVKITASPSEINFITTDVKKED